MPMPLSRLWRRDDGVAAIEFALAMPLLVTLAVGGFEVSAYAMLNIKLQHAANSMAELATMDEELPASTLDAMFTSVGQIVSPYPFAAQGSAIVSGVGAATPEDPPTVNWQRSGAGSLSAASSVGAPGGAATVPETLPVTPADSLVTAEIVYRYESSLLGLVPATTIRKISYYRPRFGTLPSLS